MKSAACCRVLCLEGGTTSETVVSVAEKCQQGLYTEGFHEKLLMSTKNFVGKA